MNNITLQEWDRPVNGGNGILNHQIPDSGSGNDVYAAQSAVERHTEDGIPATYIKGSSDRKVVSEQQELLFKARHIQMMILGTISNFLRLKLGSAMATSLFIQSGKVLYTSGPVSVVLASSLMGSVAFSMLVIGFQGLR